MEIVANEIEGLDFFVILKMNEILDSKTVETIKTKLENWCEKAIEDGYDGFMHCVHNLKYNKERNFVYASIDMGSMDPENGFNSLAEICDNLNAEFNSEVISHIELNGSDEILDFLEPVS